MSLKATPAHTAFPGHLARGYATFRGGRLRGERDRFRHLSAEGQHPPTLLIGCCDSRVSPEVIFDAGPGEIFVVRNIGALVPPFTGNGVPGTGRPEISMPETSLPETSCAIEYAVLALKVRHIVVMGHAQCGGIRAFALGRTNRFSPLSNANFVAKWTALIEPAAERIGPATGDFDGYCEGLCHASIVQGLANLQTYPWVKAREEAGDLTLHGAYFGVADGQMSVLDRKLGTFAPVASET